jgi:hypothetical protein
MVHRLVAVVATLVFALGTVVLADPPTLFIQQQATLDQVEDITYGVEVTVIVNCGSDDPTQFELNVGVRQGEYAAETGGVFFASSGGREEVTVTVFGPFEPGDASATAAVACGLLLEGIELGQTIKISEP